ncbi:hypothetical protein T440DRAFT_468203 [Plenodomus tracheiphilus IPT5]|uniref:Uncharacterized protein n=1 Tax=Plenodomus tracheiphilus IPT5 TaxID=1408161 RepID=A0A6A7B8M6_9PLEO|nr:hypothetical protein T440DRAFT_468203 [Plenodomus tracheiphilus IPT5]
MRYQYLFIPSALLTNAFAQTPTLSLQNNRVEQAGCAPKLHFCSNTAWRNCIAPITSPNRCVSTDRLNDVASIAIELGLCCQFYSDVNCQTLFGDKAWYPGMTEITDTFKAQVGSYMCNNGITSSICPGAGAGNTTASGTPIASPTASQYMV